MLRFSLLLCLILLNFDLSHGYGAGAPTREKVCNTLTPGHGKKQAGESPYKLIVSIADDDSGAIRLSLKATAQVTFAGFIVQARNAEEHDKLVEGQFAGGDSSQAVSCLNGRDNTWTHVSGQPKTEVETIWMPPKGYNGTIFFKGTVVQVKQAFWPDIYSDQIFFLAGGVVDEQTYQEYLKDHVEAAAPSPEASHSEGGLPYDKCNKFVCIGVDSSDCIQTKTCQMMLSAKQTPTENHFIITGKLSQSPTKYFSIGFSEDTKMGDDVVVDCIVDAQGAVKMGVSTNNEKTNRISKDKHVLKNVRVRSVDGVVTCDWTMDNHFQVDNRNITLGAKQYHLLLATGELEDGDDKAYHDTRLWTPESVNLAAVGSLHIKDISYLIKIHGGLMVVAWIGTVSIGIMFARYFKDSWPNTLLGGVKIWFAFHRPLMILSVLMMCIAQACIFYYVGGYRFGAHQIAGSIAFGLALLQPLGAAFRPHPEAASRWIFNWAHWLGGNVGQISAVVAILLATKIKIAELPHAFLYVVLVWIAFHVFVHLILLIHSACSSRSKTTDIALHELQNGQAIYIESPAKPSGQMFRTLVLFIYSLVTSTFCALLLCLIVSPDSVLHYF